MLRSLLSLTSDTGPLSDQMLLARHAPAPNSFRQQRARALAGRRMLSPTATATDVGWRAIPWLCGVCGCLPQ